MVDTLTREERSKRMSLIKNKDTKPEMVVRRLIHGMGYRYRLHDPKLPGKPDLVFPSRRKVIFVHGCFWHRHEGCHLARLPKSKLDFWYPKLEENKKRDAKQKRELSQLGWDCMIIWECELRNIDALTERIRAFLQSDKEQET